MNFKAWKFLFIFLINLKAYKMHEMASADLWSFLAKDDNLMQDYEANDDYEQFTAEKADAFDFQNIESQQFAKNEAQQFQNFDYENYDFAADSKEQVYVFLDKGQARYMPLNVNERPKIKHAGYNIDGRNINAADVAYELQNIENFDYTNEQMKRESYHNRPQRNYRKNYHKLFPKPHNCLKHQQQQRNRFNRPTPGAYTAPMQYPIYDYRTQNYYNYPIPHNVPYPLRKYRRNCKKNHVENYNEDCEQSRQSTVKPTKNCGTEQQQQAQAQAQVQAKVITKEKTTIVETAAAAAAAAESEVFVGSSQTESTQAASETQESPDFVLESAQKAVNGVNDDVIVGSTAQNPNQENEEKISKSPVLATTFTPPLTDSPITYINIIKPKQKGNKKRKLKVQSTTQNPIAEAVNQLVDNDDVGSAAQLGEKITPNNVEATTTTINQMDETTTTSPTTMTTANNEIIVDDDNKPSEDRLYAYVLKIDGTALNPEMPKHNAKRQAKYMEPIAYETLSMDSNSIDKLNKQKISRNQLSKPKRNVQVRVLDSNRPPKPRKRKPKEQGITTTTTSTPAITSSKLQFQTTPQQVNENAEDPLTQSEAKKSFPKRRKDFQKEQDLQILGSHRLFANDASERDPCLQNDNSNNNNNNNFMRINRDDDDDDYLDQDDQVYNDAINNNAVNGNELHNAELINSQNGCDDSNEIKYDDDRYFRKVIKIDHITPAPRVSLNDPCIT